VIHHAVAPEQWLLAGFAIYSLERFALHYAIRRLRRR
jgi:hypothetical protein